MTLTERGAARLEGAVAVALALLLAATWTMRDWTALSVLRLPDTDDAMRLQQIRDWLAGQSFGDLTQHRLGMAPGLAMHWSRLPDLVPGAMIAILTPLIGRHGAEVVAVIAWPTALWATALTLIGSIARRLGGSRSALTAIVIAAIAFPATALFAPGRLDHHGLQIVLLLMAVRALLAADTIPAGAVACAATVASLAIGLEGAPHLAVVIALIGLFWISGERRRLPGFALVWCAGLLLYAGLLRPEAWNVSVCDSLTRMVWRAAMLAGMAMLAIAGLGFRFRGRNGRIVVLAVVGLPALLLSWWVAPACLAPYSSVDPRLRSLWLAHVGEAQSMLDAPPVTVVGYLGLAATGLLASLWQWRRHPDRRWTVMVALQVAASVLACITLRGAPAAALLGAPALAQLVLAARRRGPALRVGAWLASAGIAYPIAAAAMLDRQGTGGTALTGDCTGPAALTQLQQLGAGGVAKRRLLAPMDLGAYALAATPFEVVAAPYHRNNRGNLAYYQFFLGTPEKAFAIARDLRLDFVAFCPDTLAELDATAGGSPRMVGLLRGRQPPPWLKPLSESGAVPQLYAVLRTLEPSR